MAGITFAAGRAAGRRENRGPRPMLGPHEQGRRTRRRAESMIEMTWLLFGLISATCWAAVQIIDKTIIEYEAPSASHYLVVTGLISFPVVLIGPVFIDVGDISPAATILSVASGVCYFLVTAFLFHALVSLDASVAAAALATVPALVAAAAWPVLGQELTALPVLAVLLISVGVFATAWRGRGALDAARTRRSWFAMLGAVATLVVEYVIDGYVVETVPGPTVFYWTRIGVAAATFLFAASRPRRLLEAVRWLVRRRRIVATVTVTNELLDMAGVAALIAAYSRGPVGLATGIAYSSPVIVYSATLLINLARPGLIPTDSDRSNRISRGIGVLLVVGGVLLATAEP